MSAVKQEEILYLDSYCCDKCGEFMEEVYYIDDGSPIICRKCSGAVHLLTDEEIAALLAAVAESNGEIQ